MADGAPITRNRLRETLQAGGLALGVGLRQARTVDTVKIMKTCGYDWLFIDCEHNSMDLDMAVAMCNAAGDAGITPIVRVPGYEHWLASRALDGGAYGIVFPHVDDGAQAARLASYCRFPPVGRRSVAGLPAQLDFRSYPQPEMIRLVNELVFVTVMIESPQAVAVADAIAAAPGVDAVLIGTNDLSTEMGHPGEVMHPEVRAAYETVIAACRKHGKFAGMGGVYNPPDMQVYIDMGAQLILAGNDFSFLMQGARARHDQIRAMKPG